MNAKSSASHPLRTNPERSASTRKTRRTEDRVLNLVMASAEGGSAGGTPEDVIEGTSIELLRFEIGSIGDRAALIPVQMPRPDPKESVFLLDFGKEDAVLVAGAELRTLPRGEGGQELLDRAAEGAALWRRERVRVHRRLELPNQLIAYADRLNRAASTTEVCQALSEFTARIVGGFTSLVFTGEWTGGELQALEICNLPADIRKLSVPPLPRFARPGLINADEARPDTGGPFAGLSPLFADVQAAMIAHVPFDEAGVLFLVERRKERIFDAEDWDLLRTLTGQATSALQRVRLFNEVRDLSLTDPLTGLANRRQMKIVLEHSLAAAQRGEGLAVAMVDLDGFKAINDEQGHVVGDRILINVAEYLRQEARGADLVVRYGGDEFLIVLPGGDAAGAEALLQRVRARLTERVGISAGVAEFQAGVSSVEALIDAADRDLYAAKRGRRTRRRRGLMPPAE